jgi:hypothetical protein
MSTLRKDPFASVQRRSLRKEPPLLEKEVLFCRQILKGLPDPGASLIERIETAGDAVGFDKAKASRVYHRKPVQAWIESYRRSSLLEIVRVDVREMRRATFTREDVLTILHDLATIPPERTKDSILGQVAAVGEMAKVLGLIVAPRSADDFFKGRTEEEIEHYANYGSFTNPPAR